MQGVQAAARTWSSVPCANVTILVDVTVSSFARRDGQSVISTRTLWCHDERCGGIDTYPERAVAFTDTYDSVNSSIEEADVELRGGDANWSKDKLSAVVTHELGHLLGFPDACMSGVRNSVHADVDCPDRESVMFAANTRSTLTDRDEQMLCARYPKPSTFWWPSLIAFSAVGVTVARWYRRRRERSH